MRIVYTLLLLLVANQQALWSQSNTSPRDLAFNPDLAPFYHGVASGDPTTDGFTIWTRVTPEPGGGPVTVMYKVSTDVAGAQVVAQGELTAEEANDMNVKVNIGGLTQGATYFYHFEALGLRSLTGRAKTLPTGQVDHLRFGVVSCANYEGGYFNAYAALAERNDIDAVLHLGDYIYEYGAGVYSIDLPDRTVEPANEIVSLSDYRSRYAIYRLDPDLIRLHQQHTMIAVWDDHESANDSYTDGAQNHQPASEGAWEVRKAIAKQVYFEWMPVGAPPDQQIYRSFAYGDLCDLIMLDTRLEGRDMPPPHFDTPDDPARHIVSDEQMTWIRERLTQSQARWRVMGNQILFTSFHVGFAAGILDGTPDWTNIDSIRQVEDAFIDNWESYPTQRNGLIDFLRDENVDNVIFVTGDSHCSWAFDVAKRPVNYPDPAFFNLPQPIAFDPVTGEGYDAATGAGSYAVEFGTPSVSSPNFDEQLPLSVSNQFESYLTNPIPFINVEYNPHLQYVDLDRHGYILLDLRPDTAQANFYYVSSQLIDTTLESFGQGAYTVNGQNRVRLSGAPSAPKSVQDPATPTTPVGSAAHSPAQWTLFGVMPNPAIDEVWLHFALNQPQLLRFSFYNERGELVEQVADAHFPLGVGRARMTLPATLASGVYILKVESADGTGVARKIIKR